MARYCVIDNLNLKQDADPAVVEEWRRRMVQEFVPVFLEEAPGLLSAVLVERHRDPIPHWLDNRASDFAWVEFWESAEANHQWWGGGMTERFKKARSITRDLRLQIQGEIWVSCYDAIE
jgi:hypothetical protein